ncbi:MAG: hypothetical protein N4A53_08130 [Pelagimonas sp.]|jgi:hypothetical protein|nr:hypothetical protein [Pelagimonas sp.]
MPIEDRIFELMDLDPLPADAEDQLDALLAQLPEAEAALMGSRMQEVLFTKRQFADFEPGAIGSETL